MKLQVYQKLVYIFGFLLLSGKLVHCRQICAGNKYTTIDAQGKQSCLLCNECPVGQGLFPPCGSTLQYTDIKNIECLPCSPGANYSDEHGPSSCKLCAICSSNEIISKACTPNENTVCSNTCTRRYYYDIHTHGCQPCSECCDNNEDIRIEECNNMPLTRQCSVHRSQRCKERRFSTTSASPEGGTEPSTMVYNSGKQDALSTSNVLGIALTVVAVILFITPVIMRIILIQRRRIRRRRNDAEAEDRKEIVNECENVSGHGNYDVMELEILAVLQEGQRWKLFHELDGMIIGQLEDMLAPDGVGNWNRLCLEYGMDEYIREQLRTNRDCKQAAHTVLEFISVEKRHLKVLDFCETMQKWKRNDILDLLKDHMFTQEEENRIAGKHGEIEEQEERIYEIP